MGISHAGAADDRYPTSSTAVVDERERSLLVAVIETAAGGSAPTVATALLDRFGDLGSVLAADADALQFVLHRHPGVAAQLVALRAASMHALNMGIRKGPLFPNLREVVSYLVGLLAHRRQEEVRALYLDSRNALIRDESVGIGSVTQSVVHPREVLRRALELGASRLILGHNHPSGDTKPSEQDIAFTRAIAEAGQLMGVHLLDHLIVGRGGWMSFRCEGFL